MNTEHDQVVFFLQESCVEGAGDAHFETIVEEAQVTDEVADLLADMSVQQQHRDEATRRRSLSALSTGSISAPNVMQAQAQNGSTSVENKTNDFTLIETQTKEISFNNDLKDTVGDGFSRIRHMDSVVETPF